LFSFFVSSKGSTRGISARAAVLYHPESSTVLYEKDMHRRLPIASTTKIMTALITLEALPTDAEITVGDEAVGVEGSSAYFKGGEVYTVYDMLHILLLRSANDAATQLAYSVGGSTQGFAELMNEKAVALGLKNTSFENPSGLDGENHYSCAYDLALITAEAMKHATFREIVAKYKYEATDLSTGQKSLFVNHNKMLKMYESCNGVKTGYTKKSGRCLVTSAKRDGVDLICVTLDAPSDWNDHSQLLSEGFGLVKSYTLSNEIKTEFEIPTVSSDTKSVIARVLNDFTFSLPINSRVEFITDIPSYLVAPVAINDKVGRIIIKENGKVKYEIPIMAVSSANKQSKRFKITKNTITEENNGENQITEVYR
ncbi:MAG: D-alanyl-D-alanine carboxypeptidase, partial [Clostridia bacterium]|nr:D-alanyl-D-alanine carboxypeptidase [Clostridia bacterium]